MNVQKDPLNSIVGDDTRVKLLRVFALNQDFVYTVGNFVGTLRKREQSVKTALKLLERDGIIRKKKIPLAGREEDSVARGIGYGFNKRYAHREFLKKIVQESMPTERDFLVKKIVRVPGVRYVVVADVFIEKPKEGVDLVIASSENNEIELKSLVQESERVIGRELRCVFLTVNDLLHRVRTNDKFIRDILEGKRYSVCFDKVGLLAR